MQEEKEDFGEAGGAYQPRDSGLIQSNTEIKEKRARVGSFSSTCRLHLFLYVYSSSLPLFPRQHLPAAHCSPEKVKEEEEEKKKTKKKKKKKQCESRDT